jgi:hypothetical protein
MTKFRGLSVLKDLIKNPVRAFNEISQEGRDFLIGALLIVVLPNIVSALLYVDYSHLKGVIGNIAEWLISVVLLYFIGKALKGNAKFISLLSAIGYARFPLIFLPVLGYLFLASIPEGIKALLKNTKGQISHEQAMHIMTHIFTPAIALGLIALALTLWSLALSVIAVRESNRFSTWRAFCSVIIVMLITTFIVAKLLKVTGVVA